MFRTLPSEKGWSRFPFSVDFQPLFHQDGVVSVLPEVLSQMGKCCQFRQISPTGPRWLKLSEPSSSLAPMNQPIRSGYGICPRLGGSRKLSEPASSLVFMVQSIGFWLRGSFPARWMTKTVSAGL